MEHHEMEMQEHVYMQPNQIQSREIGFRKSCRTMNLKNERTTLQKIWTK